MDTCNKIAKLAEASGYDLAVIGIPKTIDNDLALTDHCPGYGSAARFIANNTRDLLGWKSELCQCMLPLWRLWGAMQGGLPRPEVFRTMMENLAHSLFIYRNMLLMRMLSSRMWTICCINNEKF